MRNRSHRFWLCIAATVAVSAIAVPAASANVVKYDTTLLGHKEGPFFHGFMKSEARKCVDGRPVILFKLRPGPDRKVDTTLSDTEGDWGFTPGKGRFYVKVTREEHRRFVCLADRSPNHGSLLYPGPHEGVGPQPAET